MAKICPELMLQQSSSYVKSTRETFTIWMKSLIFHGNGCTVFNSKGEIIFRVDNYQQSCRDQVCLMNLKGQVLFSIKREKLRVFGRWNGYGSSGEIKGRPLFQIRRNYDIFSREKNIICDFGCDDENNMGINCYKIQQLDKNSSYKVKNSTGQVVAEVKQKQSSRGFGYGEDVLTLEVEPYIDHSIIVSLVTICGAMLTCIQCHFIVTSLIDRLSIYFLYIVPHREENGTIGSYARRISSYRSKSNHLNSPFMACYSY